jgi:hypothetical protein
MRPDGKGFDARYQGNTTIGTNSAWDQRASANTISQMTNPFRTNAYGGGPMSQNMSGFSHMMQNGRPIMMQDELSSPEDEGNLQPYRQESQTEGEPSSSSMSGYDLKGMFSKATKQQ